MQSSHSFPCLPGLLVLCSVENSVARVVVFEQLPSLGLFLHSEWGTGSELEKLRAGKWVFPDIELIRIAAGPRLDWIPPSLISQKVRAL